VVLEFCLSSAILESIKRGKKQYRGSTDYPVVGVTVDRDFKIVEDKKMFINRTIFKTCILK
jgi:hypothetical protein